MLVKKFILGMHQKDPFVLLYEYSTLSTTQLSVFQILFSLKF